ncbi:MAG: hypothetical protein ACTHLA_03980 [Asticcacaulis sp.]|uniref:hypothetical protein n=1 Tax=Asticcacaulis sp. TaxID=1872648 RepID=UPI003F7BAEF8
MDLFRNRDQRLATRAAGMCRNLCEDIKADDLNALARADAILDVKARVKLDFGNTLRVQRPIAAKRESA